MLRALLATLAGTLALAACKPQTPPPAATDAPAITELVKNDVAIGTGEPIVAGEIAVVHYTGWLYDPTAPDDQGRKFDSSRDRGQPFRFAVGAGSVIQGWDQGVVGMQVGGRRLLIVPSSLGYGPQGAGGVIPPNAPLLFDIELLAIDKKR
ncbi:MAG TPA: FKBP-type peptidyl-prolyl cis-trans isomerase [Povalibacter sp.]|nr:FKBP-type peptidyl-prolyl cis-trans isomerase [Povalibacter sp.]